MPLPLILFFKSIFSFSKNGLAWVLGSGYRIVIVALVGFIVFIYIGQWGRDKKIKSLGNDLNKTKTEYLSLVAKYNNLNIATKLQNQAIKDLGEMVARKEKAFLVAKEKIEANAKKEIIQAKKLSGDAECEDMRKTVREMIQ